MPDKLRMDYINSLPQPFLVRFCGDDCFWPAESFEVECGLVRIDVCGKFQVKSFAEVMEITDGHGNKHDPDDWWVEN